ncbi:MAG: YHYH protein [Pseudomonadota bacterium]
MTQSDGVLNVNPADVLLPYPNDVTIMVEGAKRVITANGIPEHPVGPFPTRGNPNAIEPQAYRYEVPAEPALAIGITSAGLHNFGIAVNGVPFDPHAAEWYLGERGSRWQYAVLSGAISLGLDANYAHVQPNGAYHYHLWPTELLFDLGATANSHSPLIGWAADGFPIYALYGYVDPMDPGSGIVQLTSSYRLRPGNRPTGSGQPGGTYDGTFLADYAHVEGAGDLDECNGRTGVTPEFPDGTYAYFLSANWPVVPRCYRGAPDPSFVHERGPGR